LLTAATQEATASGAFVGAYSARNDRDKVDDGKTDRSLDTERSTIFDHG
jgi:hypothetical protein